MPRYRIKRTDLAAGAKLEKREHPWASEHTARRIARDHLREHPRYYTVNPVAEKMMVSQEKKIKPIRKKRQVFDPMNPFGLFPRY